jgi:Xaa-Pro dipeptidase
VANGVRRTRPDIGKFAFGQFRTDYEERPEFDSLRSKRVARAREAMRKHGLDALLVWKDENIRYLTSLRAQIISGKSALLNGCLLLEDHEPILLISGGDYQRAERAMTWIEEFYPIPILEARGLIRGAVEDTLVPLFARHGLEGARIGIDECSYILVEELAKTMADLRLADGDTAIQQARLIKSDEEIALMEEAAAIAESVTQAALDAIAPGVRETEVAGEAMRTLYRLGGEMAHVSTPFVASGEHMSPPNRLCSDKIIREGDLVFIDIGAMWSGYFGDMGRTSISGTPSRRQKEVYTTVYECLEAGTVSLKAGNTNDDVTQAIVAAAANRGLEDHFISLFIGHGVGIGSNEPPYIGESLRGADTMTLQEGMTFAIEPLIWVPGVRGGGGVRLEDTIVVESGGGRALTRTAFEDRLLL